MRPALAIGQRAHLAAVNAKAYPGREGRRRLVNALLLMEHAIIEMERDVCGQAPCLTVPA